MAYLGAWCSYPNTILLGEWYGTIHRGCRNTIGWVSRLTAALILLQSRPALRGTVLAGKRIAGRQEQGVSMTNGRNRSARSPSSHVTTGGGEWHKGYALFPLHPEQAVSLPL